MKKIIIFLLVISLAVVFFLRTPYYYQLRSYVLMYFHSFQQEKGSLLAEEKINLEIPGGKITEKRDWYPFVIVFNADNGFSRYMGRDISLTILYNFGVFSPGAASSTFFLPQSPYYNSFYGGYVVRENDSGRKFGFINDKPDLEELFSVPQYDFKYLVLQSLGCPLDKSIIKSFSEQVTSNITYAGYEGWDQIDSIMEANGSWHEFTEGKRAYIQYGIPPAIEGDLQEFKPITMYGRTYVRYFAEFNSTIILYIMCPERKTVEECDREILSKTIISIRK